MFMVLYIVEKYNTIVRCGVIHLSDTGKRIQSKESAASADVNTGRSCSVIRQSRLEANKVH